jgi:hypothetical protein
LGAADHALVVRDDMAQVGIELLGAGEVDCVKRTKLEGLQPTGGANDPVVNAHERDSGEDVMTKLDGCVTER